MYFNAIEFGKRLQKARKDTGITQEELGNRVGVLGNHISCLERGRKTCSIDVLLYLSEALGVSTDYLLKGENGILKNKERLADIVSQLYEIVQNL